MHSTTLFTIAMASAPGWASYVLQDDYMAGDFFGQFSFWEDADPTNGFVDYVDQGTAQSTGLINNDGGSVMLGVNHTAVQPDGRQSVRLTSTKSYQSGLIVIDVAHMPGGICGTWPAFWTVGPDWPNQGEIDIIEGVNDQSSNDMTLHTGPGCTIASGDTQGASAGTAYSGSLTSTNCVSGAGDNQGCQIADNSQGSYGSSFNANGGGVYAMDWTSTGISMYFFPRGSVPQDATGDSPNPASWGTPVSHFSGSCDISSAFTNQQIVFDTTFCGDWAGEVWGGSTCASQHGGTCEDFVANNPSAFKDAYWSINALKVYQSNGGSSPSNAPSPLSVPHSSAPPSVGQPSASAWGAPSAAPPSSAPASQGQSSKSAWGAPSAAPSGPAPSSFVTVSSGAPAPSSGGGWAPVVTSGGAIVSAPIPGPTSAAPAPSSAPAAASPSSPAEPSQGGWPQGSHTWDSQPWQSGSWQEHETGHGAYAVGVPVHNGRRHRHLRHHKAHKAGRL